MTLICLGRGLSCKLVRRLNGRKKGPPKRTPKIIEPLTLVRVVKKLNKKKKSKDV